MTQLVRGDGQRGPVGAGQSAVRDGGGEPVADPHRSESAATLDEQEVGRATLTWVRQASLGAAVGHPGVEGRDGVGVQGHGPFRGQLPERDPKPGAGGAVVDHGVQRQVEGLTDAQTCTSQQDQNGAGRLSMSMIAVWTTASMSGGTARGRARGSLEMSGGEQQPTGGPGVPAPQGDVVEEVAHGEHGGVDHRRADLAEARFAAAPGPLGGVPGHERLEMFATAAVGTR